MDYIYIADVQPASTVGGSTVSRQWQTRRLNLIVADPGGHCALANNQFTLQPGTYQIRASAPAFEVHNHKTKLWNVDAGQGTLQGTTEYTQQDWNVCTRSWVFGRFTIAVATAFEVRHWTEKAKATYGFGVPASAGTLAEYYTTVELWKE